MSIEAMKRIKSLLQDGDKIDSHTISAVVAECDVAILTQQPATGEPVGFTYQAEIECADSTGGNGSFWRVPPDLDDETVPLSTHPAPTVPAGYVSVPLQVLKDASEALGNFVSDHGWGDTDMQAMDNLDAYIARHEAIDAAIAAAKDSK